MSYTLQQKYDYHRKRIFNCGKYGLELFCNENMYSMGFSDGINGCDNRKVMKSGSYSLGYVNAIKSRAKPRNRKK